MFTGIIDRTGRVQSLQRHGGHARLVVAAPNYFSHTPVGGSVAVNGACLSAVEVTADTMAADVVEETLRRTNLGLLQVGGAVNLERPLTAGGRFEGHIVQGHVDAVTCVVAVMPAGDSRRIRFRTPDGLERYIVEKGSVALDGVSLTVAAVDGNEFEAAIIPHTLERTTLGSRRPGDLVNLEVDILAKYVEHLLTYRRQRLSEDQPPGEGLTLERLAEQGF